jgi:hypothetical protein
MAVSSSAPTPTSSAPVPEPKTDTTKISRHSKAGFPTQSHGAFIGAFFISGLKNPVPLRWAGGDAGDPREKPAEGLPSKNHQSL